MFYRTFALLFLCCGAAGAGPIVTFDPSDGVIAGSPGDTIGWGFRVQSDPEFLTSFAASFTLFETNPSVGFYTDYIGSLGGPLDFSQPPGAPDWVLSFDPVQQTGIGSFTIDPGALVGARDIGVIHIEYQLFGAPSSACDPSCSGSAELPFEVDVAASTPEPATCALALLGLVLLMFGSNSRKGPTTLRSPQSGRPRPE